MKPNLKLLYSLILFFAVGTIYSQDKTNGFGLKAGLNYSKYVPNKNAIDYKHKIGFYAGGFYNFKLEEKFRFQPELLFALQGSDVEVKNIVITDNGGNPMPNILPYDFEYQINELTISIPLMGQLYLSKTFYLESGPQFGFIVDRYLSSSQQLFSGRDGDFIVDDGDTFDFGVNLGIGCALTKKMSLNLRAYSGLIKRDDDIKSFVFNFGLEYRL